MKYNRKFNTFSHILMIVLSLMAVLPIVLLVTSSFTDNSSLIRNGYSFFPEKWTVENYAYIFQSGNTVPRAYGISIALTVSGTLLGTAITLMLGYGLSKTYLPGRKFINVVLLITLLFNGGLVPTYLVYTNTLHVKNTFWGLLLPGLLMNGFNVMLVKSYFISSLPGEILEAADIDGANEFQKFFLISLPLAVPIIATVAMFTAMGYWNDWNNGYVYISTATQLYSVQNLLNRMQQNMQFLITNSGMSGTASAAKDLPSEGVRMAISIIGLLPIMILYPWLQRFFISGVTLGGVKG